HVELPQDPGQAGKDQAQQLVAMLAGRSVTARIQSGSKEVRATGYSAQQQAGNVVLVEGDWNGAWVAEHRGFPRGAHDDQVDAAATAFNFLAGTAAEPAQAKSPAARTTRRGAARAQRTGGRIVAGACVGPGGRWGTAGADTTHVEVSTPAGAGTRGRASRTPRAAPPPGRSRRRPRPSRSCRRSSRRGSSARCRRCS